MPDQGDPAVRAALEGMEFRSVGPAIMGGRVAAVVGIPLGFIFERTEFPGRRILGVLVALPVAPLQQLELVVIANQ